MRISDWSSDVCSSDLLLIERLAGADAGMDEQIIAEQHQVFAAIEEIDRLGGHALGDQRAQIVERAVIGGLRIDADADERLVAAHFEHSAPRTRVAAGGLDDHFPGFSLAYAAGPARVRPPPERSEAAG